MKIVKMSLVAALLVGSSAFAIDNIKMSGNAQVFYGTTDVDGGTTNNLSGNTGGTLFDKDSSSADIGLNLNISADLVKNDLVSVSTGAGYTALSTLGLENNFVSNVWGGSHSVTTGTKSNYPSAFSGAKVENANWFNEAWVAVTAGKSTAKVGRMELDTPLAFTEKWTIEKNTFEGAVLINQDIPDTTIIGGFIGTGNGTETFGQDVNGTVVGHNLATAPVVNQNGQFTTYGVNGAYAAGVINNSVEPLTVQAWYYDVSKVAQAYWLQADVSMEGIMAGAQYSGIDLSDFHGSSLTSDVYAVMLGYEMKDMVTIKAAYSQVGKDYAAGFNTATATGTAQSKLYTEAWWMYGNVTAADTSAINITAEFPVNGIVDLGLYVTMIDHPTKDAAGALAANQDLTEVTLTAGKSFGPLDATLVYINVDTKKDATDSTSKETNDNIVQAYLTLNF